MELEARNLHVSVDGKEILKGLGLRVKQGQVHAIMGPNGSGKSTLSNAIMGNPKYKVESGEILLDGKSILEMPTDERSRAGIFLSFQYPFEVSGVTLTNFLRTAINQRRETPISSMEFNSELEKHMKLLKMKKEFAYRYLNEGFSGGEKKRCEILQMSMLKPKFAILDETDSGLDIDALKTVAKGIEKLKNPFLGIVIITHYHRILKYVKPDFVHVMVDGRIVKSGGAKLASELEKTGYEKLVK
ncbi:putative branched-chain amino acid transport ATP-binding protein LivG [Candidatus Anstonella stagnisolia]|nr:putative branched-chain amino acid transport ATP-binding protein LivG [Candidatus Anstonella stagnisolia]